MDQLLEDVYIYIYIYIYTFGEIILWKVAVIGYFVVVLVTEKLANILLTICCAIYLN
jgi:hypothetical protein